MTHKALPIKPVLELLYTNIGRGHPFYLDGVAEALIHCGDIGLVRHQQDVFEISHGLARIGWRTARWLYEHGSSGGLTGRLYEQVRGGNYNRPGLFLRLMGRDISGRFADTATPLLVAHPTLVGILSGRPNLIYLHGEPSAPKEALVTGAATVCVPTPEVAGMFVRAGCRTETLLVSGLCVEPSLVRQAAIAYQLRKERLERSTRLTGAFFSSGAEPKPHVDQLVQAALSTVREGHTVFMFAAQNGWFERAVREVFHRAGLVPVVIDSRETKLSGTEPVTLVLFESRRELAAFTARLYPQFDYFVAPSHERVNWALGLGLPLFIVDPCIGPFAGHNCDLASRAGVAIRLSELGPIYTFGRRLARLRNEQRLVAMVEAGWGKLSIDGFYRIAAFLSSTYGR
jgi:hypothetical protein